MKWSLSVKTISVPPHPFRVFRTLTSRADWTVCIQNSESFNLENCSRQLHIQSLNLENCSYHFTRHCVQLELRFRKSESLLLPNKLTLDNSVDISPICLPFASSSVVVACNVPVRDFHLFFSENCWALEHNAAPLVLSLYRTSSSSPSGVFNLVQRLLSM